MTSPTDPLVVWCQQELEYYRGLLEKYETGKRWIGEIVDGAKVDQTAKAIEDLKARIAQLDALLNQS
jgi:hypothetical protein